MTVKLYADSVYKIFGPDPERARELVAEGWDKDAIFERTGNVVAVADCSFQARTGEVFVVMGLSGSGKSTLVRCINRLIEPTSGTVRIDEVDVTAADVRQLRELRLRKMAMVFQHFALFPHMTVAENAAYGLKIRGMGAEERREKALRALEMVGLRGWADSPPENLSGGMKQRVGLARGLAVDPEILLMDEPFSALDPLIRHDMQKELLELQKKLEMTVIFITHDLHEALLVGSQIAIMKDGRFVQVGTPEEIVGDPADDYVQAFVADVDRGRVFTLRRLMRPAQPLVLGRDDLAQARKRLLEQDRRAILVVDEHGRPVGVIRERELLAHADGGDLASAMVSEVPTMGPRTLLAEAYRACADSALVAVVEDGELRGVVEPREILAALEAAPRPDTSKLESQPLGGEPATARAGDA
jgi:glycine betaine/proline transport system ATP-binding protein